MDIYTKKIVIIDELHLDKTKDPDIIKAQLYGKGIRIFAVPDVATIFKNGGIPDMDEIAVADPLMFTKIESVITLCRYDLWRNYRRLAKMFSSEGISTTDNGPSETNDYFLEKYFKEDLSLMVPRDIFHVEKTTKEIIITGGPCSGKTTGLDVITAQLRNKGIRALVIPEVATIFINGGIPDIVEIAATDPLKFAEIQRMIILCQLTLLKHYRCLAKILGGKIVIISDRGPHDSGGYVPMDILEKILREEGLDPILTRDMFDLVIHLVTTANGAEKFYTIANNTARSEPPEKARMRDELTMKAWIGNPHLKIIDNSTDFDVKISRVLKAVYQCLGIPT